MEEREETGDRKSAYLCVKTTGIFEQYFWLVRLEKQVKGGCEVCDRGHWNEAVVLFGSSVPVSNI